MEYKPFNYFYIKLKSHSSAFARKAKVTTLVRLKFSPQRSFTFSHFRHVRANLYLLWARALFFPENETMTGLITGSIRGQWFYRLSRDGLQYRLQPATTAWVPIVEASCYAYLGNKNRVFAKLLIVRNLHQIIGFNAFLDPGFPKVPLSMELLAPISTSSSICTKPTWGILWYLWPSGANPKPSRWLCRHLWSPCSL